MQIRHLLIGLALGPGTSELTPGSRRAAERGRWLAEHLGARVTLLHSTSSDEAWDATRGDYVLLGPGAEAEARVPLEAVRQEFVDRGIACEIELSPEKAWLAITRFVVLSGVELVVAGKRNEPEEEHRVGSTCTKLLRHCPGPVWVVKPEASLEVHRILAAADGSPVGDEVLEWSSWLADRCDAELHVVHALQVPFSVQWEGAEAEREHERATAARAVARIQDQLRAWKRSVEPEYHVGYDSPTRAILGGVRQLDPDLVVMGTVSRGGLAGIVVGNTAERLLDRLDRSLLTVKPRDFRSRIAEEEPGSA